MLIRGTNQPVHAHGILRDRDAAEDAVQDADRRCWRDIEGVRDPDRFDAWLYRLLVNACRDLSRRARRRPSVVYGKDPDLGIATDDFAAVADHEHSNERLCPSQRTSASRSC